MTVAAAALALADRAGWAELAELVAGGHLTAGEAQELALWRLAAALQGDR